MRQLHGACPSLSLSGIVSWERFQKGAVFHNQIVTKDSHQLSMGQNLVPRKQFLHTLGQSNKLVHPKIWKVNIVSSKKDGEHCYLGCQALHLAQRREPTDPTDPRGFDWNFLAKIRWFSAEMVKTCGKPIHLDRLGVAFWGMIGWSQGGSQGDVWNGCPKGKSSKSRDIRDLNKSLLWNRLVDLQQWFRQATHHANLECLPSVYTLLILPVLNHQLSARAYEGLLSRVTWRGVKLGPPPVITSTMALLQGTMLKEHISRAFANTLVHGILQFSS